MKKFRIQFILLFLIIHFFSIITFAQIDSLRTKIEYIVGCAKGNIGVNIQGLENKETLTINGDDKYPMLSVYKFPLALAVLNKVDKGMFSLEQNINVTKDDLLPYTWSPLRERYPQGNVSVTLDELLTYTVSESDNNGCDIIFRLLGGPEIVDQYIHSIGVTDIAIAATEREMMSSWEVQYTNWSSPAAMGKLISMFYQEKILTRKSKEYLWKIMVNSDRCPRRIKGMLPEGTIVAHKPGSSMTNDDGITAATNDVGIVTLPNGKHFVIVVFVSNSTAEEEVREKVIAEIAKVAWDYYSIEKK